MARFVCIIISMKNENNFAYCAGYIDGDGCLYTGQTIQQNGVIVYECSIQIVSVKKESLDFFKQNFGGYIIEKPRRINHKQPYVWTLKGRPSIKCADAIQPYLRDKKIQCQYYIELVKNIVPNCGKIVSPESIALRNEFINNIRANKHMYQFVTKENIDLIKDIDSIQPDDLDFPYLAGLIDSEGCFRIKKWKPKNKPNYVYAICLEIGNTKFPVFEFLMQKFGGSVVFQGIRPRKKACAIWSISAFALSQLIPKILPYLIIKKAAAEKVMEFYNTTLDNGGDRHSEEFKHRYAAKLVERERIVDEIHKLNLKGLKP